MPKKSDQRKLKESSGISKATTAPKKRQVNELSCCL